MPVVTLTTDLGLKDHYVAVIKGALLSRHESLHIIDITHQINNFDIVQAAFIFRNAWRHFPEGAIHVVSINNFPGDDTRLLVLSHNGHFFIGPDNGVFSLIFDPLPEEAYVLPLSPDDGVSMGRVYAGAVGHIAGGRPLAEIGPPAGELVRRLTFQPVIGPARIRGAVIYIDTFENVVLNISRELFERVGRGRAFSLYFKRNDPINRLSRHYYDVAVGETLCRFNSAGFLEIAINMGKAGSLLGLRLEDTVQIDFQEEAAASEP